MLKTARLIIPRWYRDETFNGESLMYELSNAHLAQTLEESIKRYLAREEKLERDLLFLCNVNVNS